MHGLQGSDTYGNPSRMSKSGFARLIGVSPGRVSQMISRGLPVDPDGKIDVAQGRLWFSENIDPNRAAAQRGAGEQGELALPMSGPQRAASERARLLREQADAAALKNAVSRGELLQADDVERQWLSILTRVKSEILAVSARVASNCPNISAADIAAFETELRASLEALANEV